MTSDLFFLAAMALSRGTLGDYWEGLAQRIVRPTILLCCPGQMADEPDLQSPLPGMR
jgi:hypothetical protein